jgi:hypothetical protein
LRATVTLPGVGSTVAISTPSCQTAQRAPGGSELTIID